MSDTQHPPTHPKVIDLALFREREEQPAQAKVIDFEAEVKKLQAKQARESYYRSNDFPPAA